MLADDWLSISQAADALGVGPRQVHRWIEAGRIHGQRVGTLWLVCRADVEKMAKPET